MESCIVQSITSGSHSLKPLQTSGTENWCRTHRASDRQLSYYGSLQVGFSEQIRRTEGRVHVTKKFAEKLDEPYPAS